jgi:hypothetical protein
VKVVRGDAVLVGKTKDREFVIEAGDGKVIFFDPTTGAEANAATFQLKRGDTLTVRVMHSRPKRPERAEPPDPLQK